MLPKENRLSSDFDFRKVRRSGRKYGGPLFSFFVLRGDGKVKNPPRFGFVVSTKVTKKASKRNRVRRVLQDEVGSLLSRVRPGVSGAFWVKIRALEADPKELRLQVRRVLRKAGILAG